MERKLQLCLYFIFILIFLSSTILNAADTVQLEAGYLNYAVDVIEIDKGVKIIKNGLDIEAPRGKINKKKNEIFLQDGVVMDYESGTIKGKKMTGLLAEDRYIFEEKVSFSSNAPQMILYTPYLELDQEAKSFKALQGVRINFGDKIIEGDETDYNDEEEILTVKRNVYIEKENGDWIRGSRAIFYLDTEGGFTVDGDVEIEIEISSE